MAQRKVAFITGASRGIGAATALALAKAGYDLALTARTLQEGEAHEHGSWSSMASALPGSLESTAAAAREHGASTLLLRSDILATDSVLAAADAALAHFGQVDVLFNNACYQGPGNMQRLLDVTLAQAENIYRGNVLTPLALVQKLLPGMLERNAGGVINMVSGSALADPPAPADQGGWGFAYPSSKAALIRMVPSLRVEHANSGLRFFNIEPGFVLTEVMKANGFGEDIPTLYAPTSPEAIAEVVRWLLESPDAMAWHDKGVIRAPQLHRKLFPEPVA